MKTIIAAGLLFNWAIMSYGQSMIVLPTDDGVVYSFGTTIDFQYVSISGSSASDVIEGDIHFAQFDADEAGSIQLEISPYAEPVASPVSLYGFESDSAGLTGSDFDAGTLLGLWDVGGLGYGQESFFDVTSFVKSVGTPYFGFELQAPGLAVFSSTSYNYGNPPELIVTTPEPSFLWLAGTGLASFWALRKRQHHETAKCR